MTALLESRVMPKPKRDDVPVKLDREVARLAQIVAAYRDISLAEYVSERLRPLVEQDLAEHQEEHSCRSTRKGRRKPPPSEPEGN